MTRKLKTEDIAVKTEDAATEKTENTATMLTQTKRFGWWWVLAVVALVCVAIFDPQQLGVLRFKISQLSIGLLAAYWADRVLFANGPYIEDSMPKDVLSAARLFARAIITLAVILGLTLGL